MGFRQYYIKEIKCGGVGGLNGQGNRYSVVKAIKGGRPAVTLAILLLCFFLAPPGEVTAAPDKPVQIKAELGWQGKVVPGRYAPAVVHLKNTGGSDLSGVIEAINYQNFTPPPPPGAPGTRQPTRYFPFAAFGERVSLPAGGEKKIILWFPVNGPGERVDFVFRSGDRELARTTQKVPGAALNGPVPGAAGVLGEVPPALERVRVTMPDGVPRAPAVLRLTGELFPRRGEELNAFRTILVTGPGASALTGEQRRALVDWVKSGGRLVVGGGLEINEALAVLPGDTISVTVGEMAERSDWQPAARWLGTSVPGPASAPVACLSGAGDPWGPQGSPLGMQFNLGEGSVTVLGFNPNQAPWRAGAPGESLWQKFLAPSDHEKWGYDPYYNDYMHGSLVHLTNNLPAEAFPGWRPVGLFLLAFLVLAAPGVYLLLRRVRHPEYAWVAVPLLAVLFAGSVYLYMVWTGGSVLANVVQVVDNRDTAQPAGYTAVGYFAPTRPNFEAVLEDPDRPVQVQALGGRPPELMNEDDEPPFTVIRGSDLTVRFSDASQWNMRGISFRNDNVAETARGLTASVEVEGNKIKGRVQNKTGLNLDHVTFFFGSDYKVAGDLKPGESAGVEMKVATPQYNPHGQYQPPYPSSWQVFMYPQGPPSPPKPGMPPEPLPPGRRLNVEEQRKVYLMDNWMGNITRRGPVETGWPLTVLAWSDNPAGEPGIKNLSRRPYYLTMFVLRPEIKLLPGPFTIPAGLVIPEAVDQQVRGFFGHNNLLGLEGGSLEFMFKPHLEPGAKINKITLHLDYFPVKSNIRNGMGPPAPSPAAVPEGVLQVYHPGRGDWQTLAGSSTFDLPGDYATAGGEVRVRVLGGEPAKGTGFYFLPPAVAYGGEKA
jgi:hypothetical protein